VSDDRDRRIAEAEAEARRAGQMARVALIVAAAAIALSILGLFLPLRLS
jgi:CHASE3 domain sensor protein